VNWGTLIVESKANPMIETTHLQEQHRESSHSTKPRIVYAKPSITELEVAYATDAARHGCGKKYYILD
jgi:hypothetical protein